jgi:hypothetical protein
MLYLPTAHPGSPKSVGDFHRRLWDFTTERYPPMPFGLRIMAGCTNGPVILLMLLLVATVMAQNMSESDFNKRRTLSIGIVSLLGSGPTTHRRLRK